MIKFLSSSLGQLFIYYMMRYEFIVLCNPVSILLPLSATLLISSSEMSIFGQQIVFFYFFILFFWWRFRTTFLNLEFLTEGSSIDKDKDQFEATWPTILYLVKYLFCD